MRTRNPSHPTAKTRLEKQFFPGSLLPVENAFVTEAKILNASTKFIVRDSTTAGGRAQGKKV